MSPPIELEFVLVSSDYAMVQSVSAGVKKYGGKFALVPDTEAARDYLKRRKIDGVFVDLELPGAIAMIETIRKGASNSKVVIFACGKSSREHTSTLNAGANFLLRKPLNVDGVVLHITIAKELLERERRRYFRHPVNLSVLLKEGTVEQRARMTNLSEGGLAVRTVKPLSKGAAVEVSFALPLGVSLKGKGQVAWVNAEGIAGIGIQAFEGKGKEYLESWLTAQEEIERNRKTPRS
jgi:response regulator RpfG family c-di-GMP phosphodiesterase